MSELTSDFGGRENYSDPRFLNCTNEKNMKLFDFVAKFYWLGKFPSQFTYLTIYTTVARTEEQKRISGDCFLILGRTDTSRDFQINKGPNQLHQERLQPRTLFSSPWARPCILRVLVMVLLVLRELVESMSCLVAHLRSRSFNIVLLSNTIEGVYPSWGVYTIGKLVHGVQKKKRKKKTSFH